MNHYTLSSKQPKCNRYCATCGKTLKWIKYINTHSYDTITGEPIHYWLLICSTFKVTKFGLKAILYLIWYTFTHNIEPNYNISNHSNDGY